MTPYCEDCLVLLQGNYFCARCKTEQITDIKSGVDTSQLAFASVGRRFAAIFLDGLVLSIPLIIIMFAFLIPAMASGQEEPPNWFVWVSWLYVPVYIAYEGFMLQYKGQTLGKMAMKVKVVAATGEQISGGQAWGRALCRALFVSCLSLFNYLPAFFTKEKTCIHDMAARTRVVNA